MKNKSILIILVLIFISMFALEIFYLKLENGKDNSQDNTEITDEINYDNDSFTFAWMSDTQYYCESYPEIFTTDVNYILNNRDKLNIKYVIHTGDIVDDMTESYQWVNANNALKLFDNFNMPYGVLAGNHDVNEESLDYAKYCEEYGESRFNNSFYYGESYKNNKGHYDLISANQNKFIIIYMGYGVTSDECTWMNKVLQENQDRKAILCFHNYINTDGNLDEDGKEIYDNVVKNNSNVFMVLNGHYHGVSRRIEEIDDNNDGIKDRRVYEVLADYQYGECGGNGYLKFIEFDPKNNKINFTTYSPKMDDYNFYDNDELEKDEYGYKDEFSIPFDLE